MAALIAPLTLTSCSDDFLDVTPPDKATLQEYYSNKEHIMEAVASTYNPMRQYDNLFLQKMSNYASTQNPGDALTGIWDQSYKGIRNANDVLTEFLTTGRYDKRRPFYKTTSPSMDILVSSNLERLLYHVTGSDAEVAGLMKSLNETGSYTVRPETLAAIQESFGCGWSSEEEVAGEIRARYEQDGYLCDTHTAVAFHVAGRHKREGVPMVVLSTASPYKFPAAVLHALGEASGDDEFAMMEQLHALTGMDIPKNLRGLEGRPVLHTDVIDKDAMLDYVLSDVLK